MRPKCREQTCVPPIHGGSTHNLASIGQAVWEKKMFEIVDDGRRQRTDARLLLYYKLAFGSGELIIGSR